MVSTERRKGYFKVCGRDFPEVKWLKLKNLRNTYFVLFFVILTSVRFPLLDMWCKVSDDLPGYQWL